MLDSLNQEAGELKRSPKHNFVNLNKPSQVNDLKNRINNLVNLDNMLEITNKSSRDSSSLMYR